MYTPVIMCVNKAFNCVMIVMFFVINPVQKITLFFNITLFIFLNPIYEIEFSKLKIINWFLK